VLGRTKTVVIGASLMALGHFLMAFEASFLVAISLLLLGVGCFKGNIAAQVGDLYAPGDKRRASAFQIFVLAVQIAVIAAPIVCGTLGERVAWHWGFGAAGVGMVIGLVVYLAGRRWLPPEPVRDGSATAKAAGPRPAMTGVEKARLVLLIALIPVLMLSIVGNQQFTNAVPALGAEEHGLRAVRLGGAGDVAAGGRRRGQHPDDDRLDRVLALVGDAPPRARRADEDGLRRAPRRGRAGLDHDRLDAGRDDAREGEPRLDARLHHRQRPRLRQHPAGGLALYSRVAPKRLEGLVIGVYYLHLFIGNTFVGWLAGFLETMPGKQFWGLHAALVAAAGVLLLGCRLAFGKLLAPDEAPAPG
jgi:POT family proton-dependent oligopeptide transporter